MVDEIGDGVSDVSVGDHVFGACDNQAGAAQYALLTYRAIILPRAFRLALPAYGNEVISMLKSTSLASTITVMELTGAADTIVARTFSPYELFITAALIYLAITYVLTTALRALEYRLSRHMRPLKQSTISPAEEASHARA